MGAFTDTIETRAHTTRQGMLNLRLPDLIGNGVGTYLGRDHAISKIIMA
jgi:hypothetical protein